MWIVAPPRKLPDIGTLLHWIEDEGLTHEQIAQRIYVDTGVHVSRGSISAALSRAGKTADKLRYEDTVPWRVREIHLREYPVRMLRALGRRRAGLPMSDNDNQRLDNWLAHLERENAVVAYDPDNEQQGFHYIDPSPGDGDDGVPIHRQRVFTLPVDNG